METADHSVALERLRATRDSMFLSVTTMRVLHAALTLVFAVAALNYIWYHVVYRPIQRLLSQINSMSRGTWHAAIPVTRRDEIGELTAAFNDLGQQLTASFEHINSAARFSALALIGGRLLRNITTCRSKIAGAVKSYDRGTEAGHAMGREILTALDTYLDRLEERFQKDFDQELSATRRGREDAQVKLSRRPKAQSETADIRGVV